MLGGEANISYTSLKNQINILKINKIYGGVNNTR